MDNTRKVFSHLRIPAAAAIVAAACFGFRPSMTTIAVVTKVVQDVSRKTESSEWKKLEKAGEVLVSGDNVRTGEKSLAVLKFQDNSLIKLRERSELRVSGDIVGGSFSKEIELQNGAFGFSVKKQQNERFIFRSPTSVASIRGTMGRMSTGDGDTLLVSEGLVNLKNSASNEEVDVAAGFIGFSNPDGSVSTRKATQEEMDAASRSLLGDASRELKLELKDSQGTTKELKIKYK